MTIPSPTLEIVDAVHTVQNLRPSVTGATVSATLTCPLKERCLVIYLAGIAAVVGAYPLPRLPSPSKTRKGGTLQ
jgi:hypothetical protein